MAGGPWTVVDCQLQEPQPAQRTSKCLSADEESVDNRITKGEIKWWWSWIFETILFPQDMIQDIFVTLEYNT